MQKEMASIRIVGNEGIVSEKFTYKLKGNKSVDVFARDEKYLMNVARILCYPDEVPPCVVKGISKARENEEKEMVKKQQGTRGSESKGTKGREPMSFHSTPEEKGETAVERAMRLAKEREAKKKKSK